MSDKHFIERTFEFFTSMPGQVLMAGLVGGVLRWLTTEKTWRGGLASLVAGAASAWYVAPPLAAYLSTDLPVGPKNVELVAVCAFFAGVGGISLVALIVNVSRGLNANIVAVRVRNAFLSLFGIHIPMPPADNPDDTATGGPRT